MPAALLGADARGCGDDPLVVRDERFASSRACAAKGRSERRLQLAQS